MTDTTRTKSQLRVAVASKLGVLNAGDTINGNDSIKIDNAIDNKLRELEEDGLISFDIDDSYIEVNVFDPLALIIADSLTEDFALDMEMTARINDKAQKGMMKLRKASFQGGLTKVTRGDYF